MLCRPHLLSLSVHGCDRVERLLCRHLRSCVCLDICGTGIRDRDLLALTEVCVCLDSVEKVPKIAPERCRCDREQFLVPLPQSE